MKKTGIKILLMVLIVTMLIPSVVVASACDPKYEDLGDVDISIIDAIEMAIDGALGVLADLQNVSTDAANDVDVIENAPKNASINYENKSNVTIGTSKQKIYTMKAGGKGIFKSKTTVKNFKFNFKGDGGYYDFCTYFSSPYSEATTKAVTKRSFNIYTNKGQTKKAPTSGGSYKLIKDTTYYVKFEVTNTNASSVYVDFGAKQHLDASNVKNQYSKFYYTEPDGDKESVKIYNSTAWASTAYVNESYKLKNNTSLTITDYVVYLNRRDLLVLNYLIRYPGVFKGSKNETAYKDLVSKIYALTDGSGNTSQLKTEKSKAVTAWNTVSKIINNDIVAYIADYGIGKAADALKAAGSVLKNIPFGTIAQIISMFDITISNKGDKLITKIDQVIRNAGGTIEYTGKYATNYYSGVKLHVYQKWSRNSKGHDSVKQCLSVSAWNDKRTGKNAYVYGRARQKGSFQAIGINDIAEMGKLGSRYDVGIDFAGLTIV